MDQSRFEGKVTAYLRNAMTANLVGGCRGNHAFHKVSKGDEGRGPDDAQLLEPRQDIIDWMGMDGDRLQEFEEYPPAWAATQALQVWHTGLPPLDTEPAPYVRLGSVRPCGSKATTQPCTVRPWRHLDGGNWTGQEFMGRHY